jgi:hypothetical protein
MEPVVRIELTTHGLQNRCSTTELNWLDVIEGKAFHAVIPTGFFNHGNVITFTSRAQGG